MPDVILSYPLGRRVPLPLSIGDKVKPLQKLFAYSEAAQRLLVPGKTYVISEIGSDSIMSIMRVQGVDHIWVPDFWERAVGGFVLDEVDA